MEHRLRRIWERFKPWVERVAHVEMVVSVWNMGRSIIPYAVLIGAPVVIIVYGILASEMGPYLLAAGLATFALVLWVRNLLRFGSELSALRMLLTKPPEIRTEYVTQEPPDYKRLKEFDERNRQIDKLLDYSLPPVIETRWLKKEVDPRIILTSLIRNLSTYTLVIEDNVEGNISINGERLAVKMNLVGHSPESRVTPQGQQFRFNLQIIFLSDKTVETLVALPQFRLELDDVFVWAYAKEDNTIPRFRLAPHVFRQFTFDADGKLQNYG